MPKVNIRWWMYTVQTLLVSITFCGLKKENKKKTLYRLLWEPIITCMSFVSLCNVSINPVSPPEDLHFMRAHSTLQLLPTREAY